MTETSNKNDKPGEPAYPGGEDEASRKQLRAPAKKKQSNDFPVDETDDGPAGPDEAAHHGETVTRRQALWWWARH
jgi:hypothetical protein